MFPLFLLLLSLTFFYLGERIVEKNIIVLGIAAVTLALSLILVMIRHFFSKQPVRQGFRFATLGYFISAFGLALFYADPRLQAVWPFVLLLGLLPTITIELSIHGMRQAPLIELWKIKLAKRAALSVVFALISFAGFNYAASVYNRKIDLSYFKTTHVGEATQKIVHDISEPLEFLVFFPPSNDVLEQLRLYLTELQTHNSLISVKILDQALDPEQARTLKVRNNGEIVIKSNNRQENLTLGLDIEKARLSLRDLDHEIQSRILSVIKPERTIYFTTGHLERDFISMAGDNRLGLAQLKILATSLGFQFKRLGLNEGLDKQIPKDAAMLMVIDPKEAFLASEAQTISDYFKNGGNLLIAMDRDSDPKDKLLLEHLGLQIGSSFVANSKNQVRIEGRAQSPYDFFSNSVRTHASVKTLKKHSDRTGVVFLGTTYLTLLKNNSYPWEFTMAENLIAAAEMPNKGRAIVVADADVFGNGIIRNVGNTYLALDSLRWLSYEEQYAGSIASEKDVPMVHRQQEDKILFYSTSFLLPLLLLAISFKLHQRQRVHA